MKELKIMEEPDAPSRRRPEYSGNRKRRRRRRRLRRLRVWCARAAAAVVCVLVVCLALRGVRFFIGKFAGESTEVFGEAADAFWEKPDEPLIVIDAGHGGNDQGTHAGDLLEKDVNLSVAKLLRKELKKNGWRVLMTREDDSRVELSDRTGLANEKSAAVFISIHCNYCEDSAKIRGTECYYMESSDESRTIAERISAKFDEELKIKSRGVKTEDFHVLRQTKMPAVLVELGYFSNAAEKKKLSGQDYQKLLAQCIAEAMNEYYFEPVSDGGAGENESL